VRVFFLAKLANHLADYAHMKIATHVDPLRKYCVYIIAMTVTGLAFLPRTQALSPPPDGGYPGGNTAEGHVALLSLTTGAYNTALGVYSLLSLTDGNFNTALGAGTLLANTADENTATGRARS
jgi:hypothetical protein